MSLSQRLSEYIAAAFTGLWVHSYEHEDALTEIARLCKKKSWSLAIWDVDQGLQLPDGQAAAGSTDPLAAIKAVNALAAEDSSALLLLPNFHRFLGSAEVVQALAHQVHLGKQNRTFIVVLSPVVQIPVELLRRGEADVAAGAFAGDLMRQRADHRGPDAADCRGLLRRVVAVELLA